MNPFKKLILTIALALGINSTYNAQTWSAVGTGFQAPVFSFCEYNGELYAGGLMNKSIAKWNGTTWSDVDSGLSSGLSSSRVYAMQVFNGELYVGGSFYYAGGIHAEGIAKWNGTGWSDVGSGHISFGFGSVRSMAVYNNELYIGGDFTSINVNGNNMTVGGIAKWNGSSWSSLGTGLGGFWGSENVYAMTTHNNELFVGGAFTTINGIPANFIAKWNGTLWSSVSSGTNMVVSALAVYNNELYAGGNFDTAGSVSVNHIAKWNNSTWSAIGSGGPTSIYTLAQYNNELFGGGFNNTLNHFGSWNGASWSASGTGLNGTPYATIVFNNELYVGGYFTTAGGVVADNIAKYTIAGANVHENSITNTMNVFPNPATDKLQIQTTKGEVIKIITLYNSLGQKIKTISPIANSTSYQIVLNGFTPGIYFYEIMDSENNISSGKIIKE